MTFLLTLLITTALVFVLRKPLQRLPGVFYLLALVLTGVYLYANYAAAGVSVNLWLYLLFLVQRSTLALALFTLVMFAGVFPKGSRAREVLYPLRRQLAIIGFILSAGHIIGYLNVFLPLISGGATQVDVSKLASVVISLVATVLLVVLTLTSVVAVRKTIAPARWKQVQTLSYPFFLLIFLHLALILLPSAAAGSGTAAVNLVVYAALFASYSVLRLRRAQQDKRKDPELAIA
jgi:DMSO/TMAO reductase YedYZ heme-binding membrane subunit